MHTTISHAYLLTATAAIVHIEQVQLTVHRLATTWHSIASFMKKFGPFITPYNTKDRKDKIYAVVLTFKKPKQRHS